MTPKLLRSQGFYLIAAWLFLSLGKQVAAQPCFLIESILVDACGPNEGQNEMVRFSVGNQPLNTNDLNVSWATTTNAWLGVCQSTATAAIVSQLNSTILNCGYLIEPPGGILPANADVLLISSVNYDPLSSDFVNLADTLFVIFHCGTSTVGNFANAGTGLRTLTMSFSAPSGCSQSVTYDRSLLSGNNGDFVNFDAAGNDTYGNLGCTAAIEVPDPSWNPPLQLCATGGVFDLNLLVTGTPGGTWSGSGVSGSLLNTSGLLGYIDITYTVGIPNCVTGNASETHSVELIQGGSASWSSPGQVCQTDGPLDLSQFILGTPGGNWSGTGVTGSTFNPAGINGNVNITYSIGQSFCTTSSTDAITVVVPPNPAWTTFSICQSDAPVDLDLYVTGSTGGEWSGAGVNGNLFDPTGLSGPVPIRYDLSATSCAAMLVQNVTVNAGPDASFTLPAPICQNANPLNLNTLITGLAGGIWSGQGVSGNTFNPQTLNGLIPITYIVTDAATGCSTQLTQDISVIVTASAAWTSPGALCDSDAAIDLSLLVTGTAGGTFSGTGVTGNSFNPAGLSGNFPINYTAGSGSCSASQVNFINVLLAGSPSWTPVPLCETDASIDLNTLVSGTAGGTWSGNGVAGNLFNPAGLSGNIAITYTLSNGNCTASSVQNINILAGSDASWTVPAALCDNDTPIDLSTLVTGNQGGTWTGSGVSGSIFDPLNLSGLVNITYSVGSGQCAASEIQTIPVNSAGNPQFIPMAMCSNEAPVNMDALLTGDPGGTWSGPGLNGSIFNPAGQSGIITITYTLNANGCSADYTDSFSVTEASDAGFTLPAEICDNATPLDLNTSISGDAGGTWSGTGVSGNQFNPSGLNGPISITYSVGSGSCADTQNQTITVNPSGDASFSVLTLCENDAAIDLNTLLTGTPGGIWSGNSVNGNNFSPAGLNGNVAITYSVGSGLCIASLTQNFTVITNGDATFALPAQICESAGSINLNNYLSGTAGGTWTGSGVTGSNLNPTGLNGSITITYTVGSGSCADTQQQNTSVSPDQDPSFNASNVCTADGLIDLNTLLTGSPGGTWSGTGVVNNFFDPSALNGPIEITYTVGSGICIETAIQNVTVITAGDASFTLPASICEGEQLNDLNAFVTGTPGGNWSGSGVAGNSFDASGLSGIVVVTYTAGTGTCTDVQTNSINVQAIPAQPLVNDTAYCNNETAPVLSAVGDAGAIITWYGAGAPDVVLAQGNSYQIQQNSQGQFLITQTINGCVSNPALVEVTMNQAPLAPALSGNGLLCNGVLMQAITANTSGTINWYINSVLSTPLFTGNTLAAGTVLNADDDLLVQSAENGCLSGISDFPLNDPGVLTANILGEDEIVVCLNQEDAVLISEDAILNVWSNGSVNQQIEINEAGIYFLNRSNECGTASDTVRVIDGSADASFFVEIPSDAFVPSYVIPTALSAGGQTCTWLQNDAPLEFGLSGVLISEESDQIFTHICVSELGCADTITRIVKLPLPAELYVPNSFTPNGDGNNDSWQPVGSRIKDLNIEIFNRWGELVWQITNPLGFWDGKSKNGVTAPEGVYTFKLRARDMNLKDYEFFGAIYLIR